MRQGLAGRRFDTMVGLLKQGKSFKEVAEWLEVDPTFVKKYAKKKDIKPDPKPKKNDVLEKLTGEQLAIGAGFELKELRRYVVEYYGVELSSNSSRESTVKEFLNAKSKASGA